MNDELRHLSDNGIPLVGMMMAHVRNMTPERWMDQLIGAVGSALLIGIAGWAVGIATKADVNEIKADQVAHRQEHLKALKDTLEEAERNRQHQIEDAAKFGALAQHVNDLEKRVDIQRNELNQRRLK